MGVSSEDHRAAVERTEELENVIRTMVAIANDIGNDNRHFLHERSGARMVSVAQREYLKKVGVEL